MLYLLNSIGVKFNSLLINNEFKMDDNIVVSLRYNNNILIKKNNIIRLLYGYKLYSVICVTNNLKYVNLIFNKKYIKIINFNKLGLLNIFSLLKKFNFICLDKYSGYNLDILTKKKLIKSNKYYHFIGDNYKDFYICINNFIKGRIKRLKVLNSSIINLCLGKFLLNKKRLLLNLINFIKCFNLEIQTYNKILKFKLIIIIGNKFFLEF